MYYSHNDSAVSENHQQQAIGCKKLPFDCMLQSIYSMGKLGLEGRNDVNCTLLTQVRN